MFGEQFRSKSSSLCTPLFSRLSLRPKYSPQHPILIHLQPTYLTQC
jgi:hypothetical protein